MTQLPIDRLRAQIAADELEADAAQLEVAQRLDALARQLNDWRPRRGRLHSLLSRSNGPAPRGLYIHGDVGRGKTMLMDMFFACVASRRSSAATFTSSWPTCTSGSARRAASARAIPSRTWRPAFAEEAGLLCFDELQVTDIADAMLLGRLFKHLFERGVVVVATSNSAPAALYETWAQPAAFPALHRSDRRAHGIVAELKAAKDYRLEKLAGLPLYFAPAMRAPRPSSTRTGTA